MGLTARRVLLTGGTGIIGGNLVASLLERGMVVHALVRGSDPIAARARLLERLAKNGNEQPLDLARVHVHLGDTTLPELGLPHGTLAAITDIVHCSGSTAFKDDEPGWRANIVSAHNVIAAARAMARRPRVFYVSTASVCIPRAGGTVREDDPVGGFSNGYIDSKRAAEAQFAAAAADLQIAIVRPSIVIGEGIDDKRMARSILWVIPAMAMLGDVPVEASSRIDLVSVRFVARALAGLVARPSLRHLRYHLSAGPEASATCGQVVAALAAQGHFLGQIRLHGSGPWPKRRQKGQLAARMREAMDFYVPFLNADVVYDRTRLDAELGAERPPCPPVTDYVHRVMGLISTDEAVEESHRP